MCLVAIVVPALVATVALLELDRGTGGLLVAVAVPTFTGLSLVSLRWTRTRLGPVTRWLAGDRGDPDGAWDAAHGAPRAYLDRMMLQMAGPFVLVLVVVLVRQGVPTLALLGLAMGAALSVGAAWVGITVFAEALLRPLLTDISLARPGAAVDQRGLGITARLTAGMVAASFPTGQAGVAATGFTDSVGLRVVLGVAASGLMATYLGVIFRAMVVRPVLHPIRELTLGAARVEAGDFTGPVPVTTADELGHLSAEFNAMQRGLAERASLHAAFGTYVDPGLAERLVAQGHSTFTGEEADVTVFFADIRGFTGYSESVSAAEAFERLNELFAVVVPLIRDHGGHPNRYLGDGVLAVFGAPEPLADHADRALAAARSIQEAVAATFEGGLRIGIGLNTGPVIAGTIGGGGKLEYTVIGDVVNVAARVEELTKTTGDGVLLTEATRFALTDSGELIERGAYEIRGKAHPVTLYAVALQVDEGREDGVVVDEER